VDGCALSERASDRTRRVDRGHYAALHRDGRELIRGWLERAGAQPQTDSFEAFIYLWIAFNAWASCVTGLDRDDQWQQALSADRELGASFQRLVDDHGTRLSRAARHFQSLWPVFKVEELRRKRISYWRHEDLTRDETARMYYEAGARLFEPRCYFDHGDEPPLDWPHTLPVMYRVRCNLFHGEKSRGSENDQIMVTAAFEALFAFVTEACLLD
jgi:hypothetical protein